MANIWLQKSLVGRLAVVVVGPLRLVVVALAVAAVALVIAITVAAPPVGLDARVAAVCACVAVQVGILIGDFYKWILSPVLSGKVRRGVHPISAVVTTETKTNSESKLTHNSQEQLREAPQAAGKNQAVNAASCAVFARTERRTGRQ